MLDLLVIRNRKGRYSNCHSKTSTVSIDDDDKTRVGNRKPVTIIIPLHEDLDWFECSEHE